ncbi:hypothetical protein SDC9_113413 [bioreactor metagenome]|uniref:Pyridoxamine 5'-phosphate oxidase putative domain-containing protein n=1 Tax=bioreactor metagenome TaxID=1076179 RepID=A0A645BMM9_9ZZZZ
MKEMRRHDREVTDYQQIIDIIRQSQILHLAMAVGDEPYLVPLNYGFEADHDHLTIYFHCAKAGQKIAMIEQNPRVCFAINNHHELITGATACAYSYKYQSVIGKGTAVFLSDPLQKAHGMNCLMHQLTGKEWSFTESQLATVLIGKIDVTEISGKQKA